MPTFRGYPVVLQTLTVARERYELLAPADSEALVDSAPVQQRFAQDEYLPYWATIWPAAELLAEEVSTWPAAEPGDPNAPHAAASPVDRTAAPAPAGPAVLELGCGLGLVGVVAARRGYRVVFSDYDDDALAFALENARRNGVAGVRALHVDWRKLYPELRFERILAADVLYEARNLAPVAAFIRTHLAPGGFALLSDPGRGTADAFERIAGAAGLCVEFSAPARVQAAALPSGAPPPPAGGRLYRLS